MRQIILDTETTGLEPQQGHRIIELAGIELLDRRYSRSNFHRYLNPGRESDPGALQVHGLTTEFLQDKPRFADIADEFLDYIRDAELIIHNAPFDVGFLNAELALIDREPLAAYCRSVTDTLRMAKDLHPGKRNSLDALCERYQVDNSRRTLHGALLDAELLGDVFLAMTRGQESLVIDHVPTGDADARQRKNERTNSLVVLSASDEEMVAHDDQLAKINKASQGGCVWLQLTGNP